MYPINIGMLIFGKTYTSVNMDIVLNDAKQFLEQNSKLTINFITSYHPPLALDEQKDFQSGCAWAAPWKLYNSTKALFPKYVSSNVVLYFYSGLGQCYGGGTFGGDYGVNGVPYSAIPFRETDSPWYGWSYNLTQNVVHEWLHALGSILCERGSYCDLPGIDGAEKRGYTIDKGWKDWYKDWLSLITDDMYRKVYGNLPTEPTSPTPKKCIQPIIDMIIT